MAKPGSISGVPVIRSKLRKVKRSAESNLAGPHLMVRGMSPKILSEDRRGKMKHLLYVAVVTAALMIIPILSAVALAQSVPSDRNLCRQNCSLLLDSTRIPGDPMGYYNNCMSGCESRFWSDFDKNSRDLEKDLGKASLRNNHCKWQSVGI